MFLTDESEKQIIPALRDNLKEFIMDGMVSGDYEGDTKKSLSQNADDVISEYEKKIREEERVQTVTEMRTIMENFIYGTIRMRVASTGIEINSMFIDTDTVLKMISNASHDVLSAKRSKE